MKNKFNENLLVLRKRKGFTQGQLGEKLGIGHAQVCLYENGKAEPNLSMLLKMGEILCCGLEELTGQ